jgi:hypothetical protein
VKAVAQFTLSGVNRGIDTVQGLNWDMQPLYWVGSDPANRYTGNTVVAGNGYTAYDGVLSNFKSAHTGSLLVTAAGDYTLTIDSDSGSLIGIGNGAQRVSGPLEGVPASGLTGVAGLPVLAAKNQTDWAGGRMLTTVIRFLSAGTYPYEVDHANTSWYASLTLRYQPAGSLAVRTKTSRWQSPGHCGAAGRVRCRSRRGER